LDVAGARKNTGDRRQETEYRAETGVVSKNIIIDWY
jgi:hypothetical protein